MSIFDAGFTVGDGVWEGLRLHRGALMFLGAHLDRLYAGAAAIDLDIGLTREALVAEIMRPGFVSSSNATNLLWIRAGRGGQDVHRRLLLQRCHPRHGDRSLP